MEVFVIPIGRDRYELYCEMSPEPFEQAPPTAGLVAKLRHRVMSMLHAAEERRRAGGTSTHEPATTWMGRLHERIMAWVAERIAEQRLLWNLRGEAKAVAAHPHDMTFAQVHELILRTLRHDYERHRRWLVVDAIAFLVTFIFLGPFFLLVPGVANLPALYFGFRVVGHWLSKRGATHGMKSVVWTGRACEPLTELRDLAALEPDAREAPLQDIAMRLGLQHLQTYFERVAVRR